jgi:hypothetical protein
MGSLHYTGYKRAETLADDTPLLLAEGQNIIRLSPRTFR